MLCIYSCRIPILNTGMVRQTYLYPESPARSVTGGESENTDRPQTQSSLMSHRTARESGVTTHTKLKGGLLLTST